MMKQQRVQFLWNTVYIYIWGSFFPWRNFDTCKIHVASTSLTFSYILQRYCTALQQQASAKLCGVALRNRITELSRMAPPVFGWAAITLGIGSHSSSSSFFPACSQRSQIGCLPYFHTWCGLSVNLECRFEMCCTRLAKNTGRKNSPCALSHNFVGLCLGN